MNNKEQFQAEYIQNLEKLLYFTFYEKVGYLIVSLIVNKSLTIEEKNKIARGVFLATTDAERISSRYDTAKNLEI